MSLRVSVAVVVVIMALNEYSQIILSVSSCQVTGKGVVKVLKESNTTLKQLDLSKTKVKKTTLKDIQTIMDSRDEDKKRAKAQKLRESKIISLLTTSASDAMANSLLELDANSNDDSGMSSEEDSLSRSSHRMSSNRSGGASLKKSLKSAASTASSKHSASSKNSGKGSKTSKSSNGRSLNKNNRPTRAGRGTARAGTGVRASMTARQMATMGGDLVSGIGADAKTLREQRKMRGECLSCGQKCFEKKLFKTNPLTIPHKVFEGRCLKCNPM